jgi:hypothetical protein
LICAFVSGCGRSGFPERPPFEGGGVTAKSHLEGRLRISGGPNV